MVKVGDIMRTGVITASPDTGVRDLLILLANRRVTGVPVIGEGGRVVGVVAVTDVVRYLALAVAGAKLASADLEGGMSGTSEALWSWAESAGIEALTRTGLDHLTVADIMTPVAYSLSPRSSIAEAADAMHREGTHRVIVTEDDELVGIVTMTDIVRAVAEGQLRTSEHEAIP